MKAVRGLSKTVFCLFYINMTLTCPIPTVQLEATSRGQWALCFRVFPVFNISLCLSRLPRCCSMTKHPMLVKEQCCHVHYRGCLLIVSILLNDEGSLESHRTYGFLKLLRLNCIFGASFAAWCGASLLPCIEEWRCWPGAGRVSTA